MTQQTKARSGLIPVNLPIHFQCLRDRVEWYWEAKPRSRLYTLAFGGEPRIDDRDCFRVRPIAGKATTFDPWEKRDEFLRLRKGDNDALLSFLNTVGLLGVFTVSEEDKVCRMKGPDGISYSANYQPCNEVQEIWHIRRLIQGSLENLSSETGEYGDFKLRLATLRGTARATITTTTFLEALTLTLRIDRLLGAKVQKCSRPDCGVTFTVASGHQKKYCTWYCGHLESVRKQRRTASARANLRERGKK